MGEHAYRHALIRFQMEERWERKQRRMYAEMDAHVDRLIKMMRDKDKFDEEGKRADTEARM